MPAGQLRTSPLVAGLAAQWLDATELKALDRHIAIQILARKEGDPSIIDTAFAHALLAEEEGVLVHIARLILTAPNDARPLLAGQMSSFRMADNTRARNDRPLRSAQLPLKGLVFDADGNPMSPSFGYGRGGRVYRYYVSAPLQQGRKVEARDGVLRRVSAEALEEAVRTHLATVMPGGDDRSWADLLKPVRRVEVLPQDLRIAFEARALPRDVRERLHPCDTHADRRVLIGPVRCQARGGRTWVLTPACGSAVRKARRDPVLVRGLRKAHRVGADLGWKAADGSFSGKVVPTNQYDRRLWRLVFLAPDIQQAIMEGRQPRSLTLDQLLRMRIPTAWTEQRHALGFDGK